MNESSIGVVREVLDDLYNSVDTYVTDELFHPDYICHTTSGDMNRDEFKAYVAACRKGIPDLHFQLCDISQDGDVVEWDIRVLGTHRGELFGIAPTGMPIDIWTHNRMRLLDGRPIEQWIGVDMDGVIATLSGEARSEEI